MKQEKWVIIEKERERDVGEMQGCKREEEIRWWENNERMRSDKGKGRKEGIGAETLLIS